MTTKKEALHPVLAYSSKYFQTKRRQAPKEWKLVSLRDCPTEQTECCKPADAADYWRTHVEAHPYFTPEQEMLVVLALDTRRKVRGHYVIGIGLIDQVLAHPREIFRTAIVAGAQAIVLMHNHPSGDPTPSEGDIRVTRDTIRAGQLLKIELLDSVIVGANRHASMRELGYFAV